MLPQTIDETRLARKTLAKKKRLASQILDNAIGYLNWNTPHYSRWHKKLYRPAFEHWKQKDMTFIGNKAMFLTIQGQNKGYHVATSHDNAYDLLWSIALRCYHYTNPRVDPGPMRPFFLTGLLYARVQEHLNERPPKDVRKRVYYYQKRAIFLQFLHALGLDTPPANTIDTAPENYTDPKGVEKN